MSLFFEKGGARMTGNVVRQVLCPVNEAIHIAVFQRFFFIVFGWADSSQFIWINDHVISINFICIFAQIFPDFLLNNLFIHHLILWRLGVITFELIFRFCNGHLIIRMLKFIVFLRYLWITPVNDLLIEIVQRRALILFLLGQFRQLNLALPRS